MTDKDLANKIPPQSIEAEQGLLGGLMLDKNAIVKVVDSLRPDDFYKDAHQKIYQTMVELFEKGEPIDFLSLSNKLKEKGLIDYVGGISYLTQLINTVATASNVANYAKIIQKKKILRNLISASQEINEMAYDEAEDLDIVVDNAEKKIFNVAQRSLNQDFVDIKTTLDEAFNRIDQLSKFDGAMRGVPTGFTDLDSKLSGFQKSDLIILAARPSMGKSALALDIARNVASQQKLPVGIFSLEMSVDQIVDRMIASQANVDLWRLRTGKLSREGDDNDFVRIGEALGSLSEAPIFVDDTFSTNVLKMRAMARRLQARFGLGLIIVDYLQLIEARNKNEGSVQQMTEISRSLKGLARELNVPVLGLSQLSRAVEQRIPQIPRLADLRESGSIEQDADVVLFIYREDRYKPETARKGIADIIIAKHRNGPVGKVETYFDERRASFQNLEKNFQDF